MRFIVLILFIASLSLLVNCRNESGEKKKVKCINKHDINFILCQDYQDAKGTIYYSSSVINCPLNQVLTIKSAIYGRTDLNACPVPSGITLNTLNNDCVSKISSYYYQSICNGQNSCSVAAATSILKEPCSGTYKYLNITYSCSDPLRFFDGNTATAYCKGNQVMTVISAIYGKVDANTNCASLTSTAIVQGYCNGKKICSFAVTSDTLGGDPCPGISKYLEIKYTCAAPVSVCQKTPLTVNCPPNQFLKIYSAIYGRSNEYTCVDLTVGLSSTTNCVSATSTSFYQTKCNQKPNCIIDPNSELATSDPCPLYSKYLQLYFTCTIPNFFNLCNGTSNTLSCGNLKINILSTLFGTASSIPCTSTGTCNLLATDSAKVLTSVQTSCNGKNSCSLTASLDAFEITDSTCNINDFNLQVQYNCN